MISYFSHAYSLYSLSRCLSLVGLTPARYRKCMFPCNACLLAACFKFKRKEATCVPLCRLTQLTCTGSIFFSWIKYSRSCPAINNIFLIIDVATFSAPCKIHNHEFPYVFPFEIFHGTAIAHPIQRYELLILKDWLLSCFWKSRRSVVRDWNTSTFPLEIPLCFTFEHEESFGLFSPSVNFETKCKM